MAAGLKDLPKKITSGAKRAVATESLATVAGFASSRLIERTAYSLFRGVFGIDDDQTDPTPTQKWARTGVKAAVAVLAGGLMVTAGDKHVRAAGVGLMAGATWHVLNDFGINV